MSYSVESVNGCTKKLVFNFENLDLTQEIQTAVKNKQKSVSLKGFRKGKAPLTMVQKMYGPQIEQDAVNNFVQKELFQAIDSEKLKVVGYPSFENMNYESGKSVSFDALVEIFPEVELKDLSKLSFKADKVEIKKEEVEKMRDQYLAGKAEMKEVTDKRVKLKKGLFAVMNFQGEMEDGSKPENMKGEEFMLEIGSGQFIPGFEDGMIGMKSGETKDVELTFPADYHVAELQNAKVVFHVELLEMKKKETPEMTDELAKEFGFESAEDFNTKTEENVRSQKEREVKEKLHQEILEKLIAENSFDVPAAMVQNQEAALRKDLEGNLKQQGFNDEMMQEYFVKWNEDMKAKAEFQVKSGLILETLAEKYNVEATDADFDAKLEETAKYSGLELEQIKSFYASDANMKRNMLYAIKEEKTFEKLKEEVKLS